MALFRAGQRLDALVFPTVPHTALPATPASSSLENFVLLIQNTDPGSNAGVPNECALSVTSGGAAGGSMSVGATQFEGIPALYYRITTRIDGPRNTVSIVQVSVVFKV